MQKRLNPIAYALELRFLHLLNDVPIETLGIIGYCHIQATAYDTVYINVRTKPCKKKYIKDAPTMIKIWLNHI